MMKYATLFFITLVAFTTPSFAASKESGKDTTVTKEQIPSLVREALVNDPTILKDAVDAMQKKQEDDFKKQSQSVIKKNKADIFSNPNSPTVGGENGDVMVVEFFDYHCGYCKSALQEFVTLLNADKKVRLVLKELPILGEDSLLASRAALAVNRIDRTKYFDFHKALFANKGKFEEKTLLAEAKKLGIDAAKLKAEMAKPEVDAELENNRRLADALGIRGTPAIIIGDALYPGKMSYEEMKKEVDAIRGTAK